MKIDIKIGKLVLHGFDYHDHRRIKVALERELAYLIKENGFPNGFVHKNEILQVSAPSFKNPKDMNPNKIGFKIARSLFRSLEALFL